MPKLTKKYVDTTRPKDKETVYWDTELKGFGLRVKPSGHKSYILQYRNAEGRSRKYTIGKHGSPWTPEEARRKAKSVLHIVDDGNDPATEKTEARAALTITELADLYIQDGPNYKPDKKDSTWRTDKSNIERHIKPLLGNRTARSLVQADIARFQSDVANGKSAMQLKTKPRGVARVVGGKGSASRSLDVLATMFEFGVRCGYIETNPARGIPKYKTRRIERFLNNAELARLGDVLNEAESAGVNAVPLNVLRMLLLTGARKGEILGLKWNWVDFETGYLNLPDSKTGAKRIPLGAPALQLLSGLAQESAYVFPSTDNKDKHFVGLQKIWDKIRAQAGLNDVRIHDLRHSFASIGVASGHSLYMIGKILGHKQSRTTEIYAHLHDDPLKIVTDHTAQKIADALGLVPLKDTKQEIVQGKTCEKAL